MEMGDDCCFWWRGVGSRLLVCDNNLRFRANACPERVLNTRSATDARCDEMGEKVSGCKRVEDGVV